MKLINFTFVSAAVIAAVNVYAAEIEFKAPITKSEWKVVDNTKLLCTLEHQIPEYGKVVFESRAGKNNNLIFKTKPIKEQVETKSLEIRSVAPNYRPGIPDKNLASMTSYKYFGGELEGNDAMNIITSLEQSKNVALLFKDSLYQNKEIQVTLNNINFRKNYRDFEICVSNLLPYSFEDVSFTVVNFKPGTNELTQESKIRLDRLITYLALDHAIDDLVIDSYTDSYGTAENNRKVSRERAGVIGGYIAQSGISTELMQKNGLGEKQHIMSNTTEEGRNLNRRVVISVTHSATDKLNYNYDSVGDTVSPKDTEKSSESKSTQENNQKSTEKGETITERNSQQVKTLASTDQVTKDLETKGSINEISAAEGAAPSLAGNSKE